MLPSLSSRRNLHRALAIGLLCATCGQVAAWADNAPGPASQTYAVAMTFTTPTGTASPRVQAKAGDPFKVAMGDKSGKLMASFVITAAGPGAVKLDGSVECANASAHPVLLARLGETATVKLGEPGAPGCELALVVSEVPMQSAAK